MELENAKLKTIFMISILLTYLTAQRIHEIGHWIILQIFNRNPVFGFTGLIQLWETQPKNPNTWTQYTDPITGEQGWLKLGSLPKNTTEWVAMLIAGQIAQITVLYTSLLINHISKNPTIKQMGLLTAIINSLGQTFYHLKALTIGNYGDEYFLAYYLNTPKWVIHTTLLTIYTLGLALALTKLKTKDKKTTLKTLVAIFTATIITGPPLIIADTIIRTQINNENPYYQPIMGFATPVIITDTIILTIFKILTGRFLKNK
jgi:hypothetical protein